MNFYKKIALDVYKRQALANDLNIPCRFFNASTGNKKEMDIIIEEAKLCNRCV